MIKYFILSTLLIGKFSFAQSIANEVKSKQWALDNKGSLQTIELDLVSNYKVQGIKGIDLNIPQIDTTISRKKVIVAVLDTGIDTEHPLLKSQILTKPSECTALQKFQNCIEEQKKSEDINISKNARKTCENIWMNKLNPEVDQDGNGYPMDCQGWSILGDKNSANIQGRPDFEDSIGHGTHVAGIIQSVAKDAIILPVQVVGKKPAEPLKPLSVDINTDPQEIGNRSALNQDSNLADFVARGVNYAVSSGAKILNFSMGWPQNSDSEYLRAVIKKAQDKGIIVVAAAGNDATRALLRPCGYKDVICVAAHGPDGSLSYFSNYGSGVDIAAPGTNVLSTYPMGIRPIRFRSAWGFEYLHGTSQATPFISGLIAEMLSRGVSDKEILPRLLLSSEKLKEPLPVLESHGDEINIAKENKDLNLEDHFILSGRAQLAKALSVEMKPYLKPALKEKTEIEWDRKLSDLQVRFSLANVGSDFDASKLDLNLEYSNSLNGVIRPSIVDYKIENLNPIWKQGEEKILVINLKINDKANVSESQISSDLDFMLSWAADGSSGQMILESEITVNVNLINSGNDVKTFPFSRGTENPLSYSTFDQNLDGKNHIDYIGFEETEVSRVYHFIKFDSSSGYSRKNTLELKYKEDLNLKNRTARDLVAVRQLTPQGQTEYILGLLLDRRSENTKKVFSSIKFYVLDNDFKLKDQFEIFNEKVQLPLANIYWLTVGSVKRPAWVSLGYNLKRRGSVQDRWSDNTEKPETRFYFVNEKNQLDQLSAENGYQIADVISSGIQDVINGKIKVLLSKNLGTETHPSYVYDFAVGEIKPADLKAEKLFSINFSESLGYRNLLDTRTDKVLSLDKRSQQPEGSFWFSEGPNRSLRLSLVNLSPYAWLDNVLYANRGVVDSALRARSAFFGQGQAGAFILTNSEIQYHDLINKKSVAQSLERYTFFSDLAFTAIQFPIVIGSSDNDMHLRPSIYLNEEAGLSRGTRIRTVVQSQDGKLNLVSPARLRFKTGMVGCKPMANTVVDDDNTPALDFLCRGNLKRIKLVY